MSSLTQALGARCSGDWHGSFDAADRESLRGIVRTAFIDTAACILAGRAEPVAAGVLQWTARQESAWEASVLFGTRRMRAPLAALVNGAAGHALDYDDVALEGHPSVVLVPALLAEYERSGVGGFALVQAYAKGYAVWGELQRRMKAGLHARGWHPTPVFGVLAATAALASLRRLTPGQSAHALGLAASMAGGVVANFGSMAKPVQVGRAAESAFTAVELAQAGIDASPDALDGRAGLLPALVGWDAVDHGAEVPQGFESTLLRHRPGLKKYPVCYAAHRVADGVLDLACAHGLSLDDVAAVDATISTTTAGVMRHHRPETLAQARFSLEFIVATALLHGKLGVHEVSQATLARADVLEFIPRVRTHTSATSCPLEPSFAYTDEVVLTLKDGRSLASGPIRFARGHAQAPLSEEQLRDKLLGCVEAHEDGLAQDVLRRIDRALLIAD